MRITADVIDNEEENAAECSVPNQAQPQASYGAIPKHFGNRRPRTRSSEIRDYLCFGFNKRDSGHKLKTVHHTVKLSASSEIPRKGFGEKFGKEEDEVVTIDPLLVSCESLFRGYDEKDKEPMKSILKVDKIVSRNMIRRERLERMNAIRTMQIEKLKRMEKKLKEKMSKKASVDKNLESRLRNVQKAMSGLQEEQAQASKDGIDTSKDGIDTSKGGTKTSKDGIDTSKDGIDTSKDGTKTSKDGIDTSKDGIDTYDAQAEIKRLKHELDEERFLGEIMKAYIQLYCTEPGKTDPRKKNQWKSYIDDRVKAAPKNRKIWTEDESDGYADNGFNKYYKFKSEESDKQISDFSSEQEQTAKIYPKYEKLVTDTSDSETGEEALPSGRLIKNSQAEREQNKEKANESNLFHPAPKVHTCRAFKRSESINEEKEKTDEQYMASPMKRRKPGLFRQAMKRRFERHRNHDLYMHRHSGVRSYESPFHCRYQGGKMREMCRKFGDMRITESALNENIIKGFDCMFMHYMAKSKMDEVKANNPKAKMNEETPPQWLVEFLLKMKQEIKDEIMEELANLPRIEMQGHTVSGGKGDENQYQGDVIHPGIFCDNCDQLIHGIRYKCGNCTDFDLCQECESLPNIHNKNHIFLKIRYPVALKLYQKQKWQPFVLPTPGELFPASSKSHQPKKLYEAKFVRDETVPDGTVLSPSTRFVKSWRVLNSGKRVWTHSTKLQHIQGSAGLTPASEQVDVPHLRPGEEGIVSVLFTTPSVPGVYRSHWNFCHKSRPFGHIVWCHIVVKDLEPEEKQAESTGETLQLSSEKEQEVPSIAEVLTAVKEEHERGNMIPRKLGVKSHTATPNNTPFDLTPPKSPDHQAVSELKEIAEDKESVNSKQNIDFDPEDEASVVSLSSSESDTEFVVIPMPKCFNLSESFSSQSIPSLNQYLQSDVAGDQTDLKSEHKLVKPRKIFTKRAANTETVSQETGVPELSAHAEAKKEINETEEKVLISHVSTDGSSSEISIIESGGSSPMEENVIPKISSIHIAVTSDMNVNTDVNCTVTDDKGNVQQVEETEKEESTTDIPTSATFPKFPVEGITSIYEPASSNTEERTVQVLPERLVTAPLNAAATIYKTARDVISSFQHQGNAHARNNRDVGTSGTASSPQLNPMEQLIEMGFCNRQKNEELLKKHKNDVALVVAELVSLNDNDWYAYRHVPATPATYFD